MLLITSVIVSLLLANTSGLPSKSELTFASQTSQLIATQLLKYNTDIDGNQVHSPLGVSTILSVLSEASSGETYKEFIKVFGFPKAREELRDSFQSILMNYQNTDYCNGTPSFHTWFYIYRNNSVKEEFKRIVQDNYFVDVKDISRNEFDWSEPNTSLDLELSTDSSNSKDVIGFETLKRINLEVDEKLELPVADNYGEEVLRKDSSKFDRFVDDKQYVEKPVALSEFDNQKREQETQPTSDTIKKLEKPDGLPKQPKENVIIEEQTKYESDLNETENETVQNREKLSKNNKNELVVNSEDISSPNEPQKVSLLTNKKISKNSIGIMSALESHLNSVSRVYSARSLFHKDDITSALSASSITGRNEDSKAKMLLFNGLYFQSKWANPFYELKNEEELFYMTKEDTIKTPMMHAKGQYYIGELQNANARVICLPYQNKKYALLIILPNELEGITAVIEKFQPNDFKYIRQNSKLADVHVKLPKFQIEETSHSKSMLKSIGLNKLFSRTEADLSRLSDNTDTHIDEIVQFVNLRVDDASIGINSLSAVDGHSRSNSKIEFEQFFVNRPFVYFVTDCEDQFVLASGKVYVPEYKEEKPVSIEIELDQS